MDVAKQWDIVAPARDRQLRSGKDLSFSHVLVPTLTELARAANWSTVLDAGCGSGLLTEKLAQRAGSIVGVDVSSGSVRLANASATKPNNCRYVVAEIEQFARRRAGAFTLIVANMLLQGAPDLTATTEALGKLLTPGGLIVAAIPHPFFWPAYWKYDRLPWFDYSKEIAIVAPFRISTQRRALGETIHFHRPLAAYVAAMAHARLSIEEIVEPMPDRRAAREFPQEWSFPRFLCIRCRRSPARAV